MLQSGEGGKHLYRGEPVQRTHREVVVRAFADSKLFFEVLKAEKGMRSIEFFIVLTVASFHFSVVPGRVGPDELMPNVMLLQSFFKQGLFVRVLGVEAVGKFRAIVGLDTLNGKGKALYAMENKLSGRVGAVFLEGFQIAKTAIFVQESILVIIAAVLFGVFHCSAHQTGSGDVFHIDLDLLPGVSSLLIGLRLIFGVWQLFCHLSPLFQKAVQAGNRSRVASLTELDPEDHDPCMGISAAHVQDEFDLLRCVLIGMVVRAVRSVSQGGQRAVVPFTPAVDVLPVQPVADRRLRYPVL